MSLRGFLIVAGQARAAALSEEFPDALKVMLLSDKSPTAITVSKIIRLSVTTRAKPFLVLDTA